MIFHLSGLEVEVCFGFLGYSGSKQQTPPAKAPPLLSPWNPIRPVTSAPGVIWGPLAIWNRTSSPQPSSFPASFSLPILIFRGFLQSRSNYPHLNHGNSLRTCPKQPSITWGAGVLIPRFIFVLWPHQLLRLTLGKRDQGKSCWVPARFPAALAKPSGNWTLELAAWASVLAFFTPQLWDLGQGT